MSFDEQRLHDLIRDAARSGTRDAIIEFLKDDSEFGKLSERLYGKLEHHAKNNFAQWVGQRVIMILATAVLGAGIAWAAITGRFK